MIRRIRSTRVYGYGSSPGLIPEQYLALAVIERAVLDAAGMSPICSSMRAAALTAFEDVDSSVIFSLGWWLGCVFENPESSAQAILAAIKNGSTRKVMTKDGRRHRCGRMPSSYYAPRKREIAA